MNELGGKIIKLVVLIILIFTMHRMLITSRCRMQTSILTTLTVTIRIIEIGIRRIVTHTMMLIVKISLVVITTLRKTQLPGMKVTHHLMPLLKMRLE